MALLHEVRDVYDIRSQLMSDIFIGVFDHFFVSIFVVVVVVVASQGFV